MVIVINSILKKTSNILNKEILPKKTPPINWDKMKADLEGLSEPQLELVLRLIKHMRTVNNKDPQED
jgi:hypothetical protein